MPPALPDGQAHAAAAAAGGAEGKEKARRRACEDAAKWKSQGAMWKEAARKRAQEAERLAALYGVIERNEELKQQLKSEIAETDAALTKCAVQLSSAVAGADDAALERALREEEAQLERELAGYAARLPIVGVCASWPRRTAQCQLCLAACGSLKGLAENVPTFHLAIDAVALQRRSRPSPLHRT